MHGEMAATIQRIAHEKFTSAELGRALEDAAREVESLPPDSEPARLVKVTARDYDRAVRVPSEYVEEHAHVSSAAHQAWKEARAQSSYATVSAASREGRAARAAIRRLLPAGRASLRCADGYRTSRAC